MFPLGTVLLPGTAVPLRIFEPRYRQLLSGCLAADSTFGVVLIERGSEVGGGDERFGVGTLAHIEAHRDLGNGTHAIVALGRHRIRVTSWLVDDPYPTAETSPWPDEPDEPGADVARLYEQCTGNLRRLLGRAAEAGGSVAPATFDAPDDGATGSHLLSALVPVGSLDRQHLLEAPGTYARLELLGSLIDERLEDLDAG